MMMRKDCLFPANVKYHQRVSPGNQSLCLLRSVLFNCPSLAAESHWFILQRSDFSCDVGSLTAS